LQQRTIKKAGLMGLKSTAILGGAALAGGTLGTSVLMVAGAAGASAGFGGLIAACCAACLAQVQMLQSERKVFQKAFDELQADMADVLERRAKADAKLAEMERRTIESPALVWRAAAADIEVLGSLVSDLARSVAEHERHLAGQVQMQPPQPEALQPELFEKEAELGFTADAPMQAAVQAPVAASPIVMAELKTTLATALTSERLELCLQPIVELPQRMAKGYEATLRLRDDGDDHQGDAELRRIATATGLDHELDRALIERAVQVMRVLRARNRNVSLTCAIAGKSLSDPVFRTTIDSLIRNDAALAKALVLDISDADFRALGKSDIEQLRSWCGKGLGAGLYRLPHLKLDLGAMAAVGLRQVRIGANVILAAAADGQGLSGPGLGDIHPADLAEFLQRRGIDLLVCDVASEQVVLDLLDFGASLAVGPLFGPSRPVRPEVLEPKAVEPLQEQKKPQAAPASAPAPTPDPVEARKTSYRSMLRRA
jgi:cyclic-di-GMP phosphodiesterase, flagellum assembly factor TipF